MEECISNYDYNLNFLKYFRIKLYFQRHLVAISCQLKYDLLIHKFLIYVLILQNLFLIWFLLVIPPEYFLRWIRIRTCWVELNVMSLLFLLFVNLQLLGFFILFMILIQSINILILCQKNLLIFHFSLNFRLILLFHFTILEFNWFFSFILPLQSYQNKYFLHFI